MGILGSNNCDDPTGIKYDYHWPFNKNTFLLVILLTSTCTGVFFVKFVGKTEAENMS